MKYPFKAKIYKTGINWCVDVPNEISSNLSAVKGYIKIKGIINDFEFTQTLVPVRNSLYRLFVNGIMMKGGKTALGEIADFLIEQNEDVEVEKPKMHKKLKSRLIDEKLIDRFEQLSTFRKNEVMKYLNKVKSEVTFERNLEKLIDQLKSNEKDIRIPKK